MELIGSTPTLEVALDRPLKIFSLDYPARQGMSGMQGNAHAT